MEQLGGPLLTEKDVSYVWLDENGNPIGKERGKPQHDAINLFGLILFVILFVSSMFLPFAPVVILLFIAVILRTRNSDTLRFNDIKIPIFLCIWAGTWSVLSITHNLIIPYFKPDNSISFQVGTWYQFNTNIQLAVISIVPPLIVNYALITFYKIYKRFFQ